MKAEIEAKVRTYIRSIDTADTDLAATVWATTPEASFIHPRGHEHGWGEIVGNFYGVTMGEMLRDRSLKRLGDLTIHIYGEAAVVEFDWDFHAILADTDEPLHTSGRESQVFVRQSDGDWRLVHVHYSGPPVTGAGEGF